MDYKDMRSVDPKCCLASVLRREDQQAHLHQCTRKPAKGSKYCYQHGGFPDIVEKIWVAYGDRDWFEDTVVHTKQINVKITKKQLRFSGQDPEVGFATVLGREVLDKGTCVGSRYRTYLGTTRREALTRLLARLKHDLKVAQENITKLQTTVKQILVMVKE